MYGGSWSKALAALAHEIDPPGALGIWDGPAPRVEATVALEEGGLTSFVLTGKPLPPARGGNPWRYAADPAVVMGAILHTIARINKYGEPEFHLRDDLLRLGHALSGDFRDLPIDAARPAGDAARIKPSVARLVLINAIQAVEPRALARRRASAQAANIPFEKALAIGTAQDALNLDLFDVANAALDVLLSVDDEGKERGVLGFTPIEAEGLATRLAALAAARPIFGGAAEPNSLQDVIGCKAFAILITLAGLRIELAEQLRNELLQLFLAAAGEIDWKAAGGNIDASLPEIRSDVAVAQAALLAAGGAKTREEAERIAYALFLNAQGFISFVDTWHGTVKQSVTQGPEATKAVLVLMRSLAMYVPGTGADGLGAAINRRMDDFIEATRHPGTLGTTPGTREFIDMWENTKPQWDRQAAGLCPVEGAPPTPRYFLFARTSAGYQNIEEFYLGVATEIELQFETPYDKPDYHVEVSVGDQKIALTAKKIDPGGYIYRTDAFVPGVAGLDKSDVFDPALPPRKGP